MTGVNVGFIQILGTIALLVNYAHVLVRRMIIIWCLDRNMALGRIVCKLPKRHATIPLKTNSQRITCNVWALASHYVLVYASNKSMMTSVSWDTTSKPVVSITSFGRAWRGAGGMGQQNREEVVVWLGGVGWCCLLEETVSLGFGRRSERRGASLAAGLALVTDLQFPQLLPQLIPFLLALFLSGIRYIH